MKLLIVLFIGLFISTFSPTVFANVVINEVSSASNPEWVEIYNVGEDTVSLGGYVINFGSDSQNRIFCENENIQGNSYKIISLSSNWLSNAGDTVALRSNSEIVDSISYGSGSSLNAPSSAQSITRSPDGSSDWILTDDPTQEGEVVSFECPTPTKAPTPTKIPTPTKVPTSTKTPTPTKISISSDDKDTVEEPMSLNSKISAVRSNQINIISTPNSSDIKGASDEKESYEELEKGAPSYLYSFTTGIGLIIIVCAILLYRKFKAKNDEEDF